jgi:hypothetical protein
MKRVLAIFIVALLLLEPSLAFAQIAPLPASITANSCGTVTSTNFDSCCGSWPQACDNYCASHNDAKCPNYIPPATPPAATGPCAGLTGSALTQCKNAQASASTNAYFNPNVSIGGNGLSGSGGSFGGVSFSGIGGSILSCANVGQILVKTATNFVNQLFSKEVPTTDEKSKQELNQMNKTQQCLNGVAYSVAKKLLADVSSKTLNWINTGFGGNPLYVRDTGSYLKSISDQQLSRFIQQVPNDNPIFGNALRSALTQQATGRVNNDAVRPMTTPQAAQYKKFLGDFTQGGWSAWLNTTQVDSNNPVGAFFQATDRIGQTINQQKQNTRDEINRNEGFLDMKVCAEWKNNGQVTVDSMGLAGEPECLRYETTTPGSVIAEQAKIVTGSTVRQLEAADQINEVLGSFFDKLINNLLTKGLGSLRGGSNNGLSGGSFAGFSTGPGVNVVTGSSGQPLPTGVGTGLGTTNSNGSYSGDFDISRPQLLRAITQAQYDYIARVEDSQAVLGRLVPRVGALDYCLPGPNPTWQNGLQENFAVIDTSLNQIQSSAPNPGGSVSFLTLQGDFYDKVTAVTRAINRFFQVNNVSFPILHSYFQNGLDANVNDFTSNFNASALGDVFAATAGSAGEQAYARGFASQAYTEVSNLVSYSQSVPQINDQYNTAKTNVAGTLTELETIRAEVNAIVKTAKARHIAEQQALGNTIRASCINAAYQVDESPITPVARQESGVPNPIIQQSADASAYFYSNL